MSDQEKDVNVTAETATEVKTEGSSEETAAVQASAENTEETKQEEPKGREAVELTGLYGFKKGMTSVFDDNGNLVPVTVISVGDWKVTQIKTNEVDGYESVQISTKETKAKNTKKSAHGHYKKAGYKTGAHYSFEIRQSLPENVTLGQPVSLNSLKKGTKVQVTAKSKGRGFAGVVKRYNFGGGPASHGSGFHRRPGSIGNCTFPGRVMKGRKMPGHFGNKVITTKGLEVIKILDQEKVLLIKGSVPGAVNSIVKVSQG